MGGGNLEKWMNWREKVSKEAFSLAALGDDHIYKPLSFTEKSLSNC